MSMRIVSALCVIAVFSLGVWTWFKVNTIDYSTEGYKEISSEQFTLEDLQGYTTYVDFWAAWCLPCRQSFPWMQEMRSRYADNNLRIIAVNLDSDIDAMHAFLNDHPVDFTIVTDPTYSLFQKYGILGVPTSILFDEQGNEIWRHQGFRLQEQDKYELQLRDALMLESS